MANQNRTHDPTPNMVTVWTPWGMQAVPKGDPRKVRLHYLLASARKESQRRGGEAREKLLLTQ